MGMMVPIMGMLVSLDENWTIGTLDPYDFWYSRQSGLSDDPEKLDEVVSALIDAEIPGVQWWMPQRRRIN